KHMTEYLDYGGIQFTRGGDWCDYMYPITVIGLHPGMVFAEERILTNRSGRFGWGDDSEADVYMFDGNGEPVNDPDVKQVREGDQVFTDIRMPSDHVAILVRKQ
ncbi:MAG: hypothetical protein K9N51_05315, partial [Candidatus Pacebacteria bacterium]|nr:hypothetical protein [Candidatus Paceibacterota bacterium]